VFEKVTALTNGVGRKISEMVPGYAKDIQISLKTFPRVILTGEP
jgi:hypothetical protein